MKSEFTAITAPAPEGGFWALCPEAPGTNGQEDIVGEARQNLIESVELILEDRRVLPETRGRQPFLVDQPKTGMTKSTNRWQERFSNVWMKNESGRTN